MTRIKNPKFDKEIFLKWQLKSLFFNPVMVPEPNFVAGMQPIWGALLASTFLKVNRVSFDTLTVHSLKFEIKYHRCWIKAIHWFPFSTAEHVYFTLKAFYLWSFCKDSLMPELLNNTCTTLIGFSLVFIIRSTWITHLKFSNFDEFLSMGISPLHFPLPVRFGICIILCINPIRTPIWAVGIMSPHRCTRLFQIALQANLHNSIIAVGRLASGNTPGVRNGQRSRRCRCHGRPIYSLAVGRTMASFHLYGSRSRTVWSRRGAPRTKEGAAPTGLPLLLLLLWGRQREPLVMVPRQYSHGSLLLLLLIQ